MTNSWVNWAGLQQCTPAVLATPAGRDEVAGVIGRAAAAGHSVRVAGAGHSFTDAVLTDGTLISLSTLDRLLDVDRSTGLVRVEAGITLDKLSALMHEHGLALPNLGDIDVQSIAGATATGTHGTGARLPNLSAALRSIELTLADGSTVEVNADNDPDAWRAAKVSIGALGVVTAVTLQAVPSFVLEAFDRPVPVDTLLADLDSYVDGNDHFEFFMFSSSPIAWTKSNNRTDEPEHPRSAPSRWFNESFLQNTLFEAVCRVGRRMPATVPYLNRTVARIASSGHAIDRSYRVFATPRNVRMNEMEYAVPRAHAAEAVQRVKAIADRRRNEVLFPIEVRFVASDDAFLSPATGRDTCYIAVHTYRGMAWEPYFRDVEAVFDEYDGRPHWGKLHFQTAATLRTRYPDWDEFARVRKRLDPTGMFTNAYLERVLGRS